LLNRDKNQRLGKNGWQEVFGHPFLKSISVKDLLEKKVPAPFVPKLHQLNNLLAQGDDNKLRDLRETALSYSKRRLIEMN